MKVISGKATSWEHTWQVPTFMTRGDATIGDGNLFIPHFSDNLQT